MGVDQIYRKNQGISPVYAFSDYLQSTGWVTLYGIKDEASAYKLSSLPLASTAKTTSFSGDSGAGLKGECAFDYEFLIPQLVKGELYVTCTYYVNCRATQNASGYIKCRILHYDGTTETVIGTQQTADTINESGDGEGLSQRTTFTFDVNRFFKTSETLRVEVELYIDSTTNTDIGIRHDGENRTVSLSGDDNTNRSDFLVYVPFDLKQVI